MNQPLLSPPPEQKLLAPPKKSRRGFLTFVVILALLVAAGGIFFRIRDASALKHRTHDDAIANVSVIKAPKAPATDEITLPGNVQAWHEAPIYARTSGYLKDWKTDIGAQVKAGDLIAEIETPEVDAQLHQAQADLANAKANANLAQSTAKRWIDLLKTNSVSKQEADEKISDAAAKNAAVLSSQASVERLKELQGFQRIVAPFDGVITARNTDTGALINAGSTGTGPELFHIVDMHKLRVYIQVPENYVPNVSNDMVADLHFPQHPGQVFQAKFAQSANAIDPVARTLLVQLEIDNADGVLLPGGYTEVHIHVPSDQNAVRLPVNTLLFRAEGMQVATVDGNNHIVLKPIKISRDFGNDVEVQSGLVPDENIVINPPDSLENGEQVRIVAAKEGSDKNGQPSGKSKDDNKSDKNELMNAGSKDSTTKDNDKSSSPDSKNTDSK